MYSPPGLRYDDFVFEHKPVRDPAANGKSCTGFVAIYVCVAQISPGKSVKKFKPNQCRTLRVTAQVNITVDMAKQYAVVTKPVKLNLPIPDFAWLYTFPQGILVLNEEGTEESGTDAEAFYADKALIIISNTPPKTVLHAPEGRSSWRYDQVFPQDKATEILNEPIKNIVITVDGEDADVRLYLSRVDWKGLWTLLGK